MTVWFCSLNGDNSDGTTWDTARTDFETSVETDALAGDIILVDDGHTQTSGATVTLTFKGTAAVPVIVISVDETTASNSATNGGSLDASFSAGADYNAGGGVWDLILAGVVRSYGFSMTAGDQLNLSSDAVVEMENGTFGLAGTNPGDTININAADASVILTDMAITFGHASQGFLIGDGGVLKTERCTQTGTGVNSLIKSVSGWSMYVSSLDDDFSGMATNGDWIGDLPTAVNDGGGYQFRASNMKLPSGGSINSATFAEPVSRIEAYDVSAGTDHTSQHVEDYYGTASTDTGIYHGEGYAGGNSSLKVVTTANGQKIYEPFRVLVFERYCDANPTLAINFTHDSQGSGAGSEMLDSEMWAVYEHPSSTASPALTVVSLRCAPNADADGTEALVGTATGSGWTGTGGFSAEKPEVLSQTISSGAAGIHRIWLCFGPSMTVYVDPLVTVT